MYQPCIARAVPVDPARPGLAFRPGRSNDSPCRIKAQEGRPVAVYGALIGKQNGRDIELMNRFELDYQTIEGCVIIDRDYYNTKEEQFKQVFSDMDFLGWYSAGERPSHLDIAVHRQISEINESPLFLQLTPGGHTQSTELPVCLYESVVDMINTRPRTLFVKVASYSYTYHEPVLTAFG